jgi:hypothetical protein
VFNFSLSNFRQQQPAFLQQQMTFISSLSIYQSPLVIFTTSGMIYRAPQPVFQTSLSIFPSHEPIFHSQKTTYGTPLIILLRRQAISQTLPLIFRSQLNE